MKKVTIFQIEVRAKARSHDGRADQLARDILFLPQASLPSLNAITSSSQPLTLHTTQLYLLTGTLSSSDIDQLIAQLLVDPVIQVAQHFKVEVRAKEQETETSQHIVDVFFLPGVTDTLAESVLVGASMLGMNGLEHVQTAHRYRLDSRLNASDVQTIAESLLYNPVIQEYSFYPAAGTQLSTVNPICATPTTPATVSQLDSNFAVTSASAPPIFATIPLTTMSDEQLLAVSKEGLLALNLEEMQAISHHYRDLGREPTDIELETIAQTWSEHCSHKTFKATIRHRVLDEQQQVVSEETIYGLLKHYLMRATEAVNKPWLVSAFSDNAGIIRFTETHDIAFKVETHNHPSAIEPFGGANTGVGGVIRDVLGVSAQPIACTDILCFGPLDTPLADLPRGILPPRRIASGVVNGVRDYGNKMGIPTVNGAVLYNSGYLYNPLVFCGCLGILPHGSHPRSVQPGDLIVVLGGRTGRDGIHGATFSSGEMSSESNAQAGTAVQIGAPITEKKVADVIIQARDRQLYTAITDCGAGGFSSAIGEMGAKIGAEVALEKAPLKYQGLLPWEIWLSEAQERMVLAVPPQRLPELLDICAIEEVEASVIGSFTNTSRLVVSYNKDVVADIAMDFLHDGLPSRTLEAVSMPSAPTTPLPPGYPQGVSVPRTNPPPRIPARGILGAGVEDSMGSVGELEVSLLRLLAHPNIASKEEIIRRYDHEVQGATLLKPLVGRAGNGPGDAAVLQPILDTPTSMGIVLANGVNPLYGKISPFVMAINAVEEALRNLVAVGGDVERAAILDNFCWGNPNDPVQLGMLVEAVRGCSAAATIFGVPFISGKDSLNNEYRADGQRTPVLPTLLISAVGVIDDVEQTVDMSLKQSGNLIYLIGSTHNELAGSHYAEISEITVDTHVPKPSLTHAISILKAIGGAIRDGLVQSCHDLSEGGLAVAAAEMSLAGLLGLSLDLAPISKLNRGFDLLWPDENVSNIVALFSESPSRFLLEVAPAHKKPFEKYLRQHQVPDYLCLGTVTETGRFIINSGDNQLIDLSVGDLQQAWKGGQS